MKYFYLLFFNLLILISIQAQRHDCTWVLGYGGGINSPYNDSFGLSILDFSTDRLLITDNQEGEQRNRANNIGYSDYMGNLLLSFDGNAIYGADHQIIENGDNWFDGQFNGAQYYPQSALMIEHPNDTNLICFLNMDAGFTTINNTTEIIGKTLYYSIIDITEGIGNAEVTLRKQELLDIPMDVGKLNACKHANGRDWWIIIPEFNSNIFHRFLLTSDGLMNMETQIVGENVPTGLGQATFSTDGTKHVRYNGISSYEGDYVTIYDFNRCTGLLSNFRQGNYDKEGSGGGIAVSKDSKYFYVSASVHLYQYNLQVEDILSSRTLIAEYDGYLNPFPTTFYQAQLAPDGKIYMSSTNGVLSLHVIHDPDKPCPDCNIQQHGIELPTYNAFSIPNLPNYRLGSIDDSPCDTLGIDNLPLARWRYTQDTLEPLQVNFVDLSDYEPTGWFWDFGDSNSSTEHNPSHTFPEIGTYDVCLTVSNENASHTQCKNLTFEIPVNTEETIEQSSNAIAKVFPNPFQSYLSLQLVPDWLPVDVRVLVYDAVGRMMQNRQLTTGINTLDMEEASSGVYIYQIINEGEILQQGKVVKW